MKLYDTLTKSMKEFEPIDPPRVRMYVCGPTVYDSPHIGHARSAVAFDIARRYLEYKGYDVIFTRNYTDVDDKMIERANSRGITIQQLAKQYIDEYEDAMLALNVKPPVYAPRATHLINDFIKYIEVLVDNGFAYEANGNVYFNVPKSEGYGKLSHKQGKEIEDVLRRDSEEHADEKKDPRDFALWKKQKEGEPAWESPWGKGRPGWHIECSVMSTKFLGETIDIHGGGQDLVFPHHENEIAQSEAYSGKQFVRNWMHNGFVTVDKEKMSKSLGNFFTVADILKEYQAPALRMFLISAQYRNPIDFSRDLLDQATKNWTRITDTLDKRLEDIPRDLKTRNIDQIAKEIVDLISDFDEAMDDDFNTPKALAALFSIMKMINSKLDDNTDDDTLADAFWAFETMLSVLGFDQQYIDTHSSSTGKSSDAFDSLVQKFIDERAKARAAKNWAKADEIRDELNAVGIELDDGKDGTTWKLTK